MKTIIDGGTVVLPTTIEVRHGPWGGGEVHSDYVSRDAVLAWLRENWIDMVAREFEAEFPETDAFEGKRP